MIKRVSWIALVLLALMSVDTASAQGEDDVMSQSKFGAAVAVSGNQVLIGEPGNLSLSGRTYIFKKDAATGEWKESQVLTPMAAKPMNGFGSGVAAFADLAVVVATQGEGAGAYVFRLTDEGSWRQEALLRPQDAASDSLGSEVAVSDAGVFLTVFGPDDEFRVVAFERSASDSTWKRSGATVDLPAQKASEAARPVAASDSLLIVGAPSEIGGVVFILKRDRRGWAFDQMLKGEPTEGEGEALFGSALAFTDGRLLVGAPAEEGGMGLVYVFQSDNKGEFERIQTLTAFGDSTVSHFGSSIAVSSTMALVGSFDTEERFGAVYLFESDKSGRLKPVRVLEGRGKEFEADFGTALALGDEVAVIGSRTDMLGYGSADIYEQTVDADLTLAGRVRATLAYRPLSIIGGKVGCEDGEAAAFSCQGIDIISFLSNEDLGNEWGIQTNDVWGWTDPESGREYAIVATADATVFVDVSNPSLPVVLGRMPMTPGTRPNWWRDAKTYRNYVYVVADNVGAHGLQIFDLTRLRNLESPPVVFEPTALYDGFESAHNIVIDEDTGFAYVVGASGGGHTCGGGSHILDLSEPAAPEFLGCFAHEGTGAEQTGYTHDAQCVVYHGPDDRYAAREICIAANETAISIADFTDKSNIVPISVGRYPNSSYVHQGWLTDDHRYYFQNDEGDELDGLTSGTRTLVWDLAELDDPVLINEYISDNPAVDHNLYIKGSLMYQSNYLSGLRVFDISNPAEPVEVGYLDTVPWGDDGPGFGGSWSNYPFFESGTIVVGSLEEGVFFVKQSGPVP